MAIDSKDFELFQKGKVFDQIRFLDNFYETISIDKEAEHDLSKLLILAINEPKNIYVKRSALKILCELTMIKKITNTFSTLAIINNFLDSEESTLQILALKYLPHFDRSRDDDLLEKLKEFSDNPNGEVASQAYFCLGLFKLSDSILNNNLAKFVVNLEQAKIFFLAAEQAIENRVDAKFYLLFIDWSKAILGNNISEAQDVYKGLQENLIFRNLYALSSKDFELDLLVFYLSEKIKESFEIANKAKQWLEIPPQIQALLNVSIGMQKIKDSEKLNKILIGKLYNNLIETLQNCIYQFNLVSEKERLLALQSRVDNSLLKNFIEKLIETFPDNSESKNENLELLSLLAEHLSSEAGLELYNKINNKDISSEVIKAISEVLLKNKTSGLPFRTGSIIGQDILNYLMSQIDQLIPNYPHAKRELFFNILEEVIRYAKITFTGHEKKRFNFLYAESEGGRGQKAIEQDLQDDMIKYFEHSKIADGLEHEKAKFVDGGRVDIVYKKDLITIPIELKKSPVRPDKSLLEQNYIAQAQTYTAGYDQLGIFVLLELSDKAKDPPPDFRDWFNIHHLQTSSNLPLKYPDYVISVIIPGNKVTPSSKSIYK